jgi:voltage-gated potassium channel Kch
LRRWLTTRVYFSVLLAFLFSLFLLQPVSEVRVLGIRVGGLLMTLVFVGSVLAVSQRRAMFVVALLLAIPGLVLSLMRPGAAAGSGLHLVADGLVISLFFLVCICIVIELFSEQKVGLGSVSAALCIYLLIGLAFAFVYDVIERLEPNSFEGLSIGERAFDGSISGLMYYSFVTLTTLGYGDVTPLTQTARTFAMLEALLGQVVLVVLVARLVGMQVASSVASRDGGRSDGAG